MEVSAEHRSLLSLVNSLLNQIYGFPVWRDPLPAFDELVSTFLSQNTNDTNRDKAFDAIRARYTGWDEVCEADPDEFMQVIRAAGLANQKGPNIQAALRRIRSERGEIDLEWLRGLPVEEAREWLLSFRGGRKTAAIVLLFSWGCRLSRWTRIFTGFQDGLVCARRRWMWINPSISGSSRRPCRLLRYASEFNQAGKRSLPRAEASLRAVPAGGYLFVSG